MRALSVIILLASLVVLPSGQAPGSSPSDILVEELQTIHTQAAEGNADAQLQLGVFETGSRPFSLCHVAYSSSLGHLCRQVGLTQAHIRNCGMVIFRPEIVQLMNGSAFWL